MGTVLLIGGGVASSDESKKWLFKYMHEAAGGDKPKLGILSSSRKDSQTVYDHFFVSDAELGCFQTNYEALGFESIFIPLAVDNADSIKNDRGWADVLSNCDAAYLQGGNQYKHVKALLNKDGSPSLLLESLHTIIERGGLVAGTSAGMAAMGDIAFGEGVSIAALFANGMTFRDISHFDPEEIPLFSSSENNFAVPGIGLIPSGIIVDSHFDKRGRLGRLIIAMRDANCSYGIGVDEGTCLSLSEHKGRVIGDHGVFILDALESRYEKNEQFCVKNLKLHYLTEGDTFDFSTREVLVASDKVSIIEMDNRGTDYDFFGENYETTKCLIQFAYNSKQKIEMNHGEIARNGLKVTLKKNLHTKAYVSNKSYADDALKGFKHVSIQNIDLTMY